MRNFEATAAALVAKWEHGDEAHRQWLRDKAMPDLIAAFQAQNAALERVKNRIDHRLNHHLGTMKPEYDDSITGFNEAWDIVRSTIAQAIAGEGG